MISTITTGITSAAAHQRWRPGFKTAMNTANPAVNNKAADRVRAGTLSYARYGCATCIAINAASIQMYLRLQNPKVTSSPLAAMMTDSHAGSHQQKRHCSSVAASPGWGFPAFLENGCCHIAVILVALHASVRRTTVLKVSSRAGPRGATVTVFASVKWNADVPFGRAAKAPLFRRLVHRCRWRVIHAGVARAI